MVELNFSNLHSKKYYSEIIHDLFLYVRMIDIQDLPNATATGVEFRPIHSGPHDFAYLFQANPAPCRVTCPLASLSSSSLP